MAVIIGTNQKTQTYQIIHQNNNFSYINNKLNSNLIFLNIDDDTHSNATINFKNNYQLGYIDNKISVYNNSNLLTIDTININIYKDLLLHSNININNYYYTSNNSNIFNNNIILNFNNNSNNSFKVFYNSNTPVFEIHNDNIRLNTSNIYTSNIFVHPNSTLYTNFIDSPNDKPVIINNMAFAESLRIFTTNIIQSMTIDNSILFQNIIDFMPSSSNKITPTNDTTWNKYMIDNNVNLNDTSFIKPNINIIKYIGDLVGGSNILEFKTKTLTTGIINQVYSINNNGYMCIGSNYNSNIPFNINIIPFNSNIIQYNNITNTNKCFSINSNGFINIGSTLFNNNQLNIIKNNNNDLSNTELISLNINTSLYSSNNDNINISFINNNDINNFIIDINYIPGNTINFYITIYNPFIKNNILPLYPSLYDDTNNYINITYPINNGDTINEYTNDIINTIIYPKNTFVINIIERINNILGFIIYPSNLTIIPSITDKTKYNKLTFINNSIIHDFYIYITNYNYVYNGSYYPKFTDVISSTYNNNVIFSLSQYGNIGIGTNYTDNYKLYIPDNALINNINCKTIDNVLTKNISFSNCILNNINTLNDVVSITVNNLTGNNNILSNLISHTVIVNSNLTILANGGGLNVNTYAKIGNSNFFITINSNSGITINNNIINNNPNLLLLSSCSNSYPKISLQNTINNYDIFINNSNNFQIKLNNQISIFENNFVNNSITILNSSFAIFKDLNSNVKIYAGRSSIRDNWYDFISVNGTDTSSKTSFNIYGDLNFYNTNEMPVLTAYTSNFDLKIGIGTVNNNNDSNGLIIDLNTLFTSNITVKNNIYLQGTILSISDSNLKTNINKIINPLDKINKINGYTYTRIDTGNNETGLIAQEVLQILPEVIKYDNNTYNIAYGNMCGLLVECIKELNDKINSLENKLKSI